MKIIYHCDDYGMTSAVTRRIAEAWAAGLIDSFSVMANGEAHEEGAALLRRHATRDARIAVHLNLFEGRALAAPGRAPLLTDAAGDLDSSFFGLLIRWITGSAATRAAVLDQVEHEWRRQIRSVVEAYAPRPIAALDGHLHFHMLPFLFPVAVALAEEFGIGEIRITREPLYLSTSLADSLSPRFAINVVRNLVLRFFARSARKTLQASSVRSCEAFVGILYTGRMSRAAAYAGIHRCRKVGAQSVEVLFHIGRASTEEAVLWKDARKAAFPMSAMRDREYEELKALRREES